MRFLTMDLSVLLFLKTFITSEVVMVADEN